MRQWSNQHWFRQWLVAWSAPSHYQNQCWNIVNKTLRNELQWIFCRNSNIFIQENAFESVVCEKAAILSRPQWVNWTTHNPAVQHRAAGLCAAWWCTVYPKKYAHGFVVLCFVVVMQSFIMNSHEVFIHIHQCCFAGTGAIVRLPQCQ